MTTHPPDVDDLKPLFAARPDVASVFFEAAAEHPESFEPTLVAVALYLASSTPPQSVPRPPVPGVRVRGM